MTLPHPLIFDKLCLRNLIKKIKAYCMRFASVLVRKWKYDESVLEYFVQTHDKVTVKRRDLERAQWTEEMDPEEDMPDLEMMELKPGGKEDDKKPTGDDAAFQQALNVNSVEEARGQCVTSCYFEHHFILKS